MIMSVVCLILAITAHASFVSMMKFGNYRQMLRHGPENVDVRAIQTKIIQ